MLFDLITIFPEFFGSPSGAGILGHGVVGRALRSAAASVRVHDLRAFTHDRHRTVDDRPFGGGEGMVLKPQPIRECLASLAVPAKPGRPAGTRVILLSAQGRRFTQADARRLAALDRLVLICGRYEGVDERVAQLLCDEELCIGDYVLSGGELPAAVLLDAVTRLLPGVLGHADSARFESFGEPDTAPDQIIDCHPEQRMVCHPERSEGPASSAATTPPRSTNAAAGILDYPHYTRPADWEGLTVPAPLQNGDHRAVRLWRRQAALAKTLANRPDLLASAPLSDEDREYLHTLGWPAPQTPNPRYPEA